MQSKKTWLWSYRDGKDEIELIQEQLARLRSRAQALTREITGDPVMSSAAGDKLGAVIEQIEALENELTEEERKLRASCRAVSDYINGIQGDTAREIMRRRFIRGQSVNAIAREMCYDASWVYEVIRKNSPPKPTFSDVK